MYVYKKSAYSNLCSIITIEDLEIEVVSKYKYPGVLIDDYFSFRPYIQYLVRKLKSKLGLLFLSLAAKKRLVAATFLSALDYCDIIYMQAPKDCLQALDSVYHGALRFITNSKALTHHCFLYSRVGWSALSYHRLKHWYVFIYKVILGLLPSYLQQNIFQKGVKNYGLRSLDLLSIPKVRTNMGKRAFSYATSFDWNQLQDKLCLKELVSLNYFRCILKDVVVESSDCKCFE